MKGMVPLYRKVPDDRARRRKMRRIGGITLYDLVEWGQSHGVTVSVEVAKQKKAP